MKRRRRTIREKCLWALENDGLEVLFAVFVLYIVINLYNISFDRLFDLTIATSLIAFYAIRMIGKSISKNLRNKLEDDVKLEAKYDELVNRYPLNNNFVSYKNVMGNQFELIVKKSDYNESAEYGYKFPIVEEFCCHGEKIEIFDKSDVYYQLPDLVKEKFDYFMDAHAESVVFNQINIRLDDFKVREKTIELHTSRTTYYDSLVTNRCLDYKYGAKCTLRELLVPGPWLPTLSESKLSNHIGFNMYIETKDGKIIFVKRGKDVSIGKHKLGSSVSASLKTQYALYSGNREFRLEGLVKSIFEEIQSELRVDKNVIDFSLEKNFISIYRDVLEGGKPQFLFSAKINQNSEDIKKNFDLHSNKVKKKSSINVFEKMSADGKCLVFIPKSALNPIEGKVYIAPDIIVYNNIVHETLPSISATLALFIKREFERM